MHLAWIYKTIKGTKAYNNEKGERPKVIWNSPDIFSLFSLRKNSLYLFSIFSLYHFRMRGPDRLRNFWFRQSLPKIKHNVVNNSNPIIIIQKAKYTIKRKKKQKKTHKHKQIHNLSLKNILFQITKNPFII